MDILWTARPDPIITMERGVAYEINIKDIDFNNHIFDDFSYKSSLVAHTFKYSG